MTELMGGPLRIIVAGFVDIADGDSLDIGFSQKVKHDAEALSANTDESHVDFVAGRNIADTAENAAGNDAETQRRGGGLLKEFAAG